MMSTSTGLRVLVSDLVKRPGAARDVTVDDAVGELVVGDVTISDGGRVHLDLHLERIAEGLVVRGTIVADWTGSCARCVGPVAGNLTVGVDELFETEPLDGETYLLEHDTVDLEPMTRDALGLEIPLAPLCRDDCLGLCAQCGTDRNTTMCACEQPAGDPRWGALDAIDFEAIDLGSVDLADDDLANPATPTPDFPKQA